MKQVISLDSGNASVAHLCRKDKRFARVFELIGPITYSPYEGGYAFLVEGIIEQMISSKVGVAIYSRLVGLCDGKVCPDSIDILTDTQIRSIGTSDRKVSYIRSLTEEVKSGRLNFDVLSQMNDNEAIKALTAVRGIGNWTAKMYLIFCLDRQDILPFEDIAFLQGFRWAYGVKDLSPKSVQKKCAKWKPYSSIAARYMYKALDLGFTKETFSFGENR